MIDPKVAKTTLKKRKQTEKNAIQKRFEKATEDAARIIECIKNNYKPSRIYQWGSLINVKNFSQYSDIDIAVEGINDPEVFFRLIGDAMKLTKFPVDIVQIEKIEPEFAESIKESGRLLYECV